MKIGEYQCDIADVLQNGDSSILQKLSSFCCEFEEHVASKVQSTTSRESENTKRKTARNNRMAELYQNVEKLKYAIDAIKDNQNIVDKKITNIIKQEEKLRNEVIDGKARRDTLTLELDDLRQEVQERREKKRKTWDAIKRATTVYKSNLDFVIHLEKNVFDVVKVSFFRENDAIRDRYYVQLINEDKLWKVKEIHPALEKEHWTHLKGTVDFTRQLEISNITAFLCLLRIVFMKYYMDTN